MFSSLTLVDCFCVWCGAAPEYVPAVATGQVPASEVTCAPQGRLLHAGGSGAAAARGGGPGEVTNNGARCRIAAKNLFTDATHKRYFLEALTQTPEHASKEANRDAR